MIMTAEDDEMTMMIIALLISLHRNRLTKIRGLLAIESKNQPNLILIHLSWQIIKKKKKQNKKKQKILKIKNQKVW